MAGTMNFEVESHGLDTSMTPNPRASLLHVLGAAAAAAAASDPASAKQQGQGDVTDDEEETRKSPTTGKDRRTQTSSVFSGNKIKHLKKEDGIPLWRKDIQFEFLRHVFENQKPVFSNSYEEKTGYTFADVYIYAMAVSSKTSKILRDKLLSDRRAAIHMAMVCLLVNVGRMNTTLNCNKSSTTLMTGANYQKSFRKCELNFEPITPYRVFKPSKIQTHTSSCRMPRG